MVFVPNWCCLRIRRVCELLWFSTSFSTSFFGRFVFDDLFSASCFREKLLRSHSAKNILDIRVIISNWVAFQRCCAKMVLYNSCQTMKSSMVVKTLLYAAQKASTDFDNSKFHNCLYKTFDPWRNELICLPCGTVVSFLIICGWFLVFWWREEVRFFGFLDVLSLENACFDSEVSHIRPSLVLSEFCWTKLFQKMI